MLCFHMLCACGLVCCQSQNAQHTNTNTCGARRPGCPAHNEAPAAAKGSSGCGASAQRQQGTPCDCCGQQDTCQIDTTRHTRQSKLCHTNTHTSVCWCDTAGLCGAVIATNPINCVVLALVVVTKRPPSNHTPPMFRPHAHTQPGIAVLCRAVPPPSAHHNHTNTKGHTTNTTTTINKAFKGVSAVGHNTHTHTHCTSSSTTG